LGRRGWWAAETPARWSLVAPELENLSQEANTPQEIAARCRR
jgi:hypothetical protein